MGSGKLKTPPDTDPGNCVTFPARPICVVEVRVQAPLMPPEFAPTLTELGTTLITAGTPRASMWPSVEVHVLQIKVCIEPKW
jgi:hypothetical protein